MNKLLWHEEHNVDTDSTNENLTIQQQEYKQYKRSEHKRYLDQQKVGVLDKYIFQSMAYLTYFFKYVSTYKTLNEIFENDIKDLLGLRADAESEEYAFILSDLLHSILSIEFSNKNLRLELIHVVQEIIREKVEEYAGSTKRNENIKNIILTDFDRVSAWTAMLAGNVAQTAEEKVQPHRTITFESRLSLHDAERPLLH